MIAISWDIETAPDDGALADYLCDAQEVADLLAGPLDGVTPEAVEKATEMLRAQAETGWRYGRTKDPEALRKSLSRDYDALASKASSTCSFDPLRGRIVCAAFASRQPGQETAGVVRTLADFDGDEAALLRWQWEWISRVDALVTWNGVAFDSRFLHVRSALLGVRPSRILETPRGRYTPICDLMQWLSGWERERRCGLDAACRRTGIGVTKGGMDGSQVAGFVEDGRWPEIATYCLGDVAERTWPLYERFAPHIPGHEALGRALAEQPAPIPETTDAAKAA